MQMLNLGLSIFGKVQAIQHRQIKIAQSLRKDKSNQQCQEPLDLSKLTGSKKTITFEEKEI